MLRNQIHQPGRRLRMELLEPRRLMAGNVNVATSPTDILDVRIDGDDQGNQISISSVGISGVRVTGLSGTTINGSLSFFTIAVTDDVRIFMNGGADSVVADGMAFGFLAHSDLVMNLGSGQDSVRVDNSSIRGEIRINGSTGDDFLFVRKTDTGRDLVLDGGSTSGSGRQTILVDQVTVRDDLRIFGGNGIDSILVEDSDVSDDLVVDANGGSDDVTLYENTADDIRISTDSGNDIVDLYKNAVWDEIFVDLGRDDDTLIARSNNATRLRYIGGAGRDSLIAPWYEYWTFAAWRD